MTYMHRALVAVLAACTAHVPHAPVQAEIASPPIVEPLRPAIVLGPFADAASSYGEPCAAPHTDLVDRIVSKLGERAGQTIADDACLDIAASELATIVARGGELDEGVVAFALHAHGIVEPGHPFVARGTTRDVVAALTAQLGDRLAPPNAHVGIGGDPSSGVVLVVAYRSPLTLRSAPRVIHGGALLFGALDGGYRDVRVTLTRDDGSRDELATFLGANGELAISLACAGHRGTQWLALQARQDDVAFAVVPFECETEPASRYFVEPRANLRTTTPALRLAALIDRERLAAGVAPLSLDPVASEVARRYAERMRRARTNSHSIDGTTPTARLAAAGRRPIVIAESTIEADDLEHAVDTLWNTPEYRAQVLAPDMTHVGVGVAAAANELFVALDYERIPPRIDPAVETSQLVARLAPTRRTNEARAYGPPNVDTDLAQLARDYANALASGWSVERASKLLDRELHAAMRVHAYAHVGLEFRMTDDPARIDPNQLVTRYPSVDDIGVGVAQAARQGPLTGRIVVVAAIGMYPVQQHSRGPVSEWHD